MQQGFLIRWYHIFTDAFFFIRYRMYRVLKKEAALVHGELLDFGCGNKPYESLFTQTSSYVGVDIEISGHPYTKKADFFYDGHHLPFTNSKFDIVFSSEVFEHVFNLEEIVPELVRVIKPGGQLLITCPFVWPEHEQPYDYARYTSFGIRHLLEKNGLEVIRQYKTGHNMEVVMQQFIFYIYCLLPKKPRPLYFLLHQVFILPFLVLTALLSFVLQSKLRRKDLYHSNIILLKKKNS
ncbi:MAG: hypothetical protein ABS85_03630 [Sphingobacteriales bacterium SCN 48-20]|uniref:class I SAM-dependent methyltransferase n=1 Tax=Terrimonas ferruginea TaxID=249 RepID=UPI00086C4259|nr:class I SAM-dependent methyltransferase [Terrimonas ferruginea]MBN8784013.1 class I SAM-dependent methyltransferase [Terrimonas ferruginea]ODT94164.1 MAG: hypothetical protein ABS85_03630 [Sphingobacteriales bacterium SCN 48-20]OJW41682.1 MAG: hypothetical protein BGO56_17655 [Sphingobacteriales bacterium 48-107]